MDSAEETLSAVTAWRKPTDIRVVSATMYLLPSALRVPLKFGAESVTQIVCLRVRMRVRDALGHEADGWGETPLAVQWAWPSSRMGYELRLKSMIAFCERLIGAWADFTVLGHPLEIGYDFLLNRLPELRAEHNKHVDGQERDEPLPCLASLVCASALDIALHDAYGNLHSVDIYQTYNRNFMSRDLGELFSLDASSGDDDEVISFRRVFPENYLTSKPHRQLTAWHLVGGLDPLEPSELRGSEPQDGVPVLLRDWIKSDGLQCLKIKLRGTDSTWDFDRLVRIGRIALESNVKALSADFNCCVKDVDYVNNILDKLRQEMPQIHDLLLYIEQPFAYELDQYSIDVHSVSARKPLLLDESAHDWQRVRIGRKLGWTGVALKTCKTQTGAILSLCWAKAHGMPVMVQDLSNPMLAQISHLRLAEHAGTICGVETNAMQFYPHVSSAEAKIHPDIYRRRNGDVDLTTVSGAGFGYRLGEINRTMPEPTFSSDSSHD